MNANPSGSHTVEPLSLVQEGPLAPLTHVCDEGCRSIRCRSNIYCGARHQAREFSTRGLEVAEVNCLNHGLSNISWTLDERQGAREQLSRAG
jgi:hypothetical protein